MGWFNHQADNPQKNLSLVTSLEFFQGWTPGLVASAVGRAGTAGAVGAEKDIFGGGEFFPKDPVKLCKIDTETYLAVLAKRLQLFGMTNI